MSYVQDETRRIKVPIDTLPVELRIKVYEFANIDSLMELDYSHTPWSRIIYLASVFNDWDGIEIASVQGEDTRSSLDGESTFLTMDTTYRQ